MAVLHGRQACAATWRCWSSDGGIPCPQETCAATPEGSRLTDPGADPQQTKTRHGPGTRGWHATGGAAQVHRIDEDIVAEIKKEAHRGLFQVLSEARQAADLIAPEPAASEPDLLVAA